VSPKPDLQNRFVARAKLLNEMTDAQAKRLAAATAQPPADSTDLLSKPEQLMRAWNYSPSQTPEQDFWAMHDQVLQKNLSEVPSDAPPEVVQAAHNDAETQALNAVYPYRGDLIGVGTRMMDDQIKQAARIKRMVDGHTQDGTG
jgi:hypothetical protein